MERAWVCHRELTERYIVKGIDGVWVQLGVKKLANEVQKDGNIDLFCESINAIGITTCWCHILASVSETNRYYIPTHLVSWLGKPHDLPHGLAHAQSGDHGHVPSSHS